MRQNVLALLLFVCAPVVAADWVPVGADGDVQHFVDRATLARDAEVVRLSKRAVYLDPHPLGDTPGLPLVKEAIGQVECDCKRSQHRALRLQLLGVDGQVLFDSGDMKRVWESIDGGTPGRATLDYACAATGGR